MHSLIWTVKRKKKVSWVQTILSLLLACLAARFFLDGTNGREETMGTFSISLQSFTSHYSNPPFADLLIHSGKAYPSSSRNARSESCSLKPRASLQAPRKSRSKSVNACAVQPGTVLSRIKAIPPPMSILMVRSMSRVLRRVSFSVEISRG